LTPQPSTLGAQPATHRFPAEWLFAAAFGAIGSWVYFHTPIRWEAPEVTLYRNLALTFLSGFIIMIALAYGDSLLRGVPAAGRRTWTRLAGVIAVGITLGLFVLVKAPRAIALNRLVESAALGTSLTVLALTLFLPVAGLVPPRQVAVAIGEGLRLWMPYLVYHVFAGYCLAATRLATPQVWDPVLLRMDVSLGFNPSQVVHAWSETVPGLHEFCVIAYGLLGLMIAGVIARLQIARAWAHARRALLASFLVGVLGLGCYQLVPAVGPIYAFPADYRDRDFAVPPTGPAATLASALTGPDRVPGPAAITRNVVPSLHVAFTLVALAAAWSWRRRFFWWCLPLGTLQIATTLLRGVHYVVDLLSAVPLAVFCWWVADAAVRATPLAAEPPLPALTMTVRERAVRAGWLGLAFLASVGGLLTWGALAPLSPWLAWPLAMLVAPAPFWAGLHLNRPPVLPLAVSGPRDFLSDSAAPRR
jgi:hypothetical protein